MPGTFTLLAALALLGAGTYLMRFSGAKLGSRLALSEHVEKVLNDAATTLLFSVALATALFEGVHFAGIARVAGVAIAVILAWRKVPLICVIFAAAAVTSLLRLLGIH